MPLPCHGEFFSSISKHCGAWPNFGAIAGAMFGPAAFSMIVPGSIFAGAVHELIFQACFLIRARRDLVCEVLGIYLGPKIEAFYALLHHNPLIFVGNLVF